MSVWWFAAVGVACAATQPAAPAAPTEAPALVPAQSGAPVASAPEEGPAPLTADLSLSVADYQAQGLPALEQTWAPATYGEAAQVMVRIGNQQRSQLPRLRSDKSSAVFLKFTVPETFGGQVVSTDPSTTARAQPTSEQAQAYLPPVSSLIAMYAPADETGAGFEPEQVELTLVSMLLLTPIVQDERKDANLRRQMAAQLLAGSLSMLGQRDRYDAALRRRLAGGLLGYLAPFQQVLGADFVSQAAARTEALHQAEPDAQVQGQLLGIHTALQSASVSSLKNTGG